MLLGIAVGYLAGLRGWGPLLAAGVVGMAASYVLFKPAEPKK